MWGGGYRPFTFNFSFEKVKNVWFLKEGGIPSPKIVINLYKIFTVKENQAAIEIQTKKLNTLYNRIKV